MFFLVNYSCSLKYIEIYIFNYSYFGICPSCEILLGDIVNFVLLECKHINIVES